MKILLINPPYMRLGNIGLTYYPIGLGYLSSVLTSAGHEVWLLNAEIPSSEESINFWPTLNDISNSHHIRQKALTNEQHPAWVSIRSTIDSFKPDLVGISVMSAKVASAYKISCVIKEMNPNIYIVWGGPIRLYLHLVFYGLER